MIWTRRFTTPSFLLGHLMEKHRYREVAETMLGKFVDRVALYSGAWPQWDFPMIRRDRLMEILRHRYPYGYYMDEPWKCYMEHHERIHAAEPIDHRQYRFAYLDLRKLARTLSPRTEPCTLACDKCSRFSYRRRENAASAPFLERFVIRVDATHEYGQNKVSHRHNFCSASCLHRWAVEHGRINLYRSWYKEYGAKEARRQQVYKRRREREWQYIVISRQRLKELRSYLRNGH